MKLTIGSHTQFRLKLSQVFSWNSFLYSVGDLENGLVQLMIDHVSLSSVLISETVLRTQNS